MPDSFILQFMYKGKLQDVDCRVRISAYTYQILCKAGDADIIVEKDDEGNLRAMDANPFSGTQRKADPSLVKMLMQEIGKILE